MFRVYLATAFLAFGAYGLAQYKGWSVLPSAAEEFQRRRAAEQSPGQGSGGRSGGFFGSSGHK